MPQVTGSSIIEVRWHGRGGQGAVTAAQALAEAAFFDGYQGVTSLPAFGAERRGVPVTASTRFARDTIRAYSQIETPDVVVVLDETLLEDRAVVDGLKAGGWLIVNSASPPEALPVDGDFNKGTAGATRVSLDLGITLSGLVLVNTAILGAVSRATGLVSMDSLERALRKRFSKSAAELNIRAARMTYEKTLLMMDGRR